MIESVEASTILQQYKQLKITEMSSLAYAAKNSQDQLKVINEKRIRLKGQMYKLSPKRLIDAVRLECGICRGLRKLDSIDGSICCQKEMKKIFFMKILWKDNTIKNTPDFFVSWLFTFDGNPESIFQEIDIDKIELQNINEWEIKFEKIHKILMKPHRYYEFLVTHFETGVEIVDGQLPFRIVDTVFLEEDEAN